MKNSIWPLIVLPILLSASAGASMVGEKATLALNWKPEPQFGGFYEAQLGGDYSLGGFDVTIVPGGSGQPTIQMVSAGKVPFAIVSADELILARGNGAKPVALFAVYQTNPQGIMTHAERGVKSLEDLFKRGGTLAIQKGLPYANHLEKKYGFKNMKIVPYAGGISAFLADKNFSQQCFVTSEPLAARKSKADPQTFLIAESGYNPYTTVVVTNEDYARKNPTQVSKFVEATRRGWERYLKDPTRANAAMQKLNPAMDLPTFKESAIAQLPLILNETAKTDGIGSMTQARWDELATQLHSLKVTAKKVDCSGCRWTAKSEKAD